MEQVFNFFRIFFSSLEELLSRTFKTRNITYLKTGYLLAFFGLPLMMIIKLCSLNKIVEVIIACVFLIIGVLVAVYTEKKDKNTMNKSTFKLFGIVMLYLLIILVMFCIGIMIL